MESHTSMENFTGHEHFHFCCCVVENEMQKFNLDSLVYRSFLIELTSNWDVNFDIAYNRCAFMYKYATSNMLFFKDCMREFLSSCPDFKDIISSWMSISDIELCSLTCGPALDYLSFMSVLSEHIIPPSFKTTLLSKYGAWRNTVDIIPAAIQKSALFHHDNPGCLYYKDVNVVQYDFLKNPLSAKGVKVLQNAHIVLMVKCINLTAPGSKEEEEDIKVKLKEMISILRSEATVFFIDTKPSLTLFTEILTSFTGKVLHNPVHSTFRMSPVSKDYIAMHGCAPVISTRGVFCVWQKFSNDFNPNSNISFQNILQTNEGGKKDGDVHINDAMCTPSDFFQKKLNMQGEISELTKTLQDIIFTHSTDLETHCMTATDSVLHNDGGESNKEEMNKTSICLQNSECDTSKSLSINQSLIEITPNSSDSIKTSSLSISQIECGNSEKILPLCSEVKWSFPSPPLREKEYKLQNTPALNNFNVKTSETSTQYETKKKKLQTGNNKVLNAKCLKPLLQSKAIQTDPSIEIEPISYSESIKGLTDRVRGLVVSYERELERQNKCSHEMPHSTHGAFNGNASCSGHNFCNGDHSYPDTRSECSVDHKCERKHTFNHCNFSHSCCGCCSHKYRMMHCCERSHCNETCVSRCCHLPSQRPSYGNNLNNNLAGPNIVIPLQNINDEILAQIISAIKANSTTN